MNQTQYLENEMIIKKLLKPIAIAGLAVTIMLVGGIVSAGVYPLQSDLTKSLQQSE